MNSMHWLLKGAEHKWRREIRRDFPLRSDTPLVMKEKSIGKYWEFSTDLRNIFVAITNDEALQKKFETIVSSHWEGEPEELAEETLHYLLFHELYHPLEAPFSVSGNNNDNKRIHQAIRRGLLKTEPNLSPLEQVTKVQVCQNGVKDFIIDNKFYLDNREKNYTRDDIIPVWDIIELENSPSKANFYTITRFIYGALYGPEKVQDFFRKKTGEKGAEVAEKALEALIKRPVKLSKEKEEIISEIRKVFSSEDRYSGIERFISVLAPYIDKNMPQGRPDQQGTGAGASLQNILQDLLDDMTLEEQAQFVSQLAEAEDFSQFSDGEADSVADINPSEQELNTLDVFAIHEYYKRNHPVVNIVGGSKIGETVVVGKRKYWDLIKSTVITEDQFGKLNLGRISRFQKITGLPMLIPLGNNTYRLNEYKLKERSIKDIVYSDSLVDVPDAVEFYLDSSGSMYQHGSNFGFNDSSRWDMLSNVLYGFVDALIQGGRKVSKKCKIRIHNFADRQKSSGLIPAEQFWKGDTNVLTILFKPKNGYSVEDINIKTYNDGLKRVYVVVTDGNLVISGRTKRESRKMRELARDPNNEVVLFEIGGTYDLGRAVKGDPNIHYYQVHNKNRMLQNGLEVLLSK